MALLEQQAIFGITRALLAEPTDGGMRKSQHKLLVPKHLDILPLLALVAEDFAEMIEPESEESRPRTPFMLYADEQGESVGEESMSPFLHPRWFEHPHETPRLHEVLRRYRPNICISTGDPMALVSAAREAGYRFPLVVGFSILSGNDLEMLRRAGEQVMTPDIMLEKAVDAAAREMEIPQNHPARTGLWHSLFAEDERPRELEPFVAFGTAFEMALMHLGEGGTRQR